jgi:hypothetical protein
MQLTGRLVERRNSSVWQPAVRGRRVQVESDALQLSIEPKPPEFSGGEWQPARDYRLTQQISSGDALRVGEPVTRTVIIDAVGLEENMIVEPAWPDVPDTRIYPDQPQGITRDDGEWVLGHKEFRYAVVPEKEGDLVLPELKVQWWDTQSNQARTAVLPAHTVYVQPSALVPPPPAVSPVASAPAEILAPARPGGAGEAAYWRWLALGFAGLWLLTLLIAWKWKSRSRTPAAGDRAERLRAGEAEALARLDQACKSGNRREARRALQNWLLESGQGRGNRSLFEFADRTGDDELRHNIHALDAGGFRPMDGEPAGAAWNGTALWKSFEKWRKSRKDQAPPPPLSDLYAPENRRLRDA